MIKIELLKSNADIDNYADFFINALPKGYLYNSNLKDFVKGFLGVYQDYYVQFEKAINDLFFLDTTSIYLEEFKVMYGIPNTLFPDVTTANQAVFAISMMKLSKTLISKEDFENFMTLIGIPVTFYRQNSSLIPYIGFNYSFPVAFSNSVATKDKLKYLVYAHDDSQPAASFRNIGSAFDIQFSNSPNNQQEAKKILDFLKPDYLIFQYINTYTKNLYGL